MATKSKPGIVERDAGLRAVRKIARELDPEPEHVFQVCRNAEVLFRATAELHGLGARELRILCAAALLHDIGHTVDIIGHHKHSRDLIMKMELDSFSRREHRILACVARYHRKAYPKPSHNLYEDLKKSDQALVQKLAGILRIADGLDRSHNATCKSIKAEPSDGALILRVQQRRNTPTDIWGAQRKRGLFEEVFGLRVQIEAPASGAAK
ncbi:MAG: HD domain-containing protein [Candidatus Hydrogenedentes bacterium]|nr:HD domain-containing protein [Candidatus Hydrogenedentota bacterium]